MRQSGSMALYVGDKGVPLAPAFTSFCRGDLASRQTSQGGPPTASCGTHSMAGRGGGSLTIQSSWLPGGETQGEVVGGMVRDG